MGTNIFILILVTLISLYSCASKKDNQKHDPRIIDVAGSIGGGRVVNLSEIASEINFIPLETNDKSLLGTPYRGLFYENGLVNFLEVKSHSFMLKIFDKNGEFVRQFNRCGRGPQEYERISRLQIESSTGNLILKSFDKIIEYTSDGKFVRCVNFKNNMQLSGYTFGAFYKLAENNYFLSVIMDKAKDYSGVAIDTVSTIKQLVKYPEIEKKLVKELSRSYAFNEPYMYKYRDSIRLINGVNDYVLNIDKDLNIDTAFIINYGQYKIKKDYVTYRNGSNSPFINRFNEIFESNDYLFMQFHLGSLAHKPSEARSGSGEKISFPISCAIFNKTTGIFTFADQPAYDQMGFADDLEGGPAFWPSYISEDDYMVSYINAADFINHSKNEGCSEKFKQIASKLKETDNPVLVMVKLKN